MAFGFHDPAASSGWPCSPAADSGPRSQEDDHRSTHGTGRRASNDGQTILAVIPPTYDKPLNCTYGRDARIRTGSLLPEPYTRHLGGKVRELRFHLLAQQARVSYWLAPGRGVVLLTVFRKTRNAEAAEVARALQAQKICEAVHGPAHDAIGREVT